MTSILTSAFPWAKVIGSSSARLRHRWDPGFGQKGRADLSAAVFGNLEILGAVGCGMIGMIGMWDALIFFRKEMGLLNSSRMVGKGNFAGNQRTRCLNTAKYWGFEQICRQIMVYSQSYCLCSHSRSVLIPITQNWSSFIPSNQHNYGKSPF